MPVISREHPEIILASASPRRGELLEKIGVKYTRCVAGVDETFLPGLSLEENLVQIAQKKAAAIEWSKPALIIGADTVVVMCNDILVKPANGEEARAMLQLLSGKKHEVYTGICVILNAPEPRSLSAVEKTEVSFGPLGAEEIESYIASGEPMDKAGAYGIQGSASAFIESIYGDYNNVVGLPLYRLVQLVRRLGYGDFPGAWR